MHSFVKRENAYFTKKPRKSFKIEAAPKFSAAIHSTQRKAPIHDSKCAKIYAMFPIYQQI
jgi:hypothetical protein